MFKKLLPREIGFFDLFDQHAHCIVKSAQAWLDIELDGSNISSLTQQIHTLEHEADAITHNCIELLHQTFVTPLDRDDIFHLISTMDDIIDYIDAASNCLVIYKISALLPPAHRMAEILVAGTQELQGAIHSLRDLSHPETIRAQCARISHLESEHDFVFRTALGSLFDQEPDTRTLIKWKEIYDNLEAAADRCDDVANIIEGIILEYA